jgi:hypothetical protein
MKYAFLSLAVSLLAIPAVTSAPAAAQTVAVQDHAHDFDFLVGKWKVHHRQLTQRLANGHEWIEFDGTSELWMTMGGMGNVDDNYLGKPGGAYRAMSVRAFDPQKQVWSIWWLDARHPHTIEPPVVGNFSFVNGIGTFEGDDTFNGKPIRVRYTWSNISKTTATWEQAFSPDGGKTWEMNWHMDFTKVP